MPAPNSETLHASAPDHAAEDPAHRALAAALDRLDDLLDRAVAVSKGGAGQRDDDRAIANAKGRALLELSRLTRPQGGAPVPAAIIQRARAVRERLLEEQRILKRRLEAAEVISGIIADAVIADEWDGTYQPVTATRAAQSSPKATPSLAPTKPSGGARP